MGVTIEQVLDIARFSPCVRRKYGAAITWEGEAWIIAAGYNERVGTCCNGDCVRDTLQIKHGTNTDAGAEIHAEQAALVQLTTLYGTRVIYVAGLDREGNLMNGFDNSPCYSCARMIKFAGINDVYLPIDGEWEKFDINDIMETWEKSWE